VQKGDHAEYVGKATHWRGATCVIVDITEAGLVNVEWDDFVNSRCYDIPKSSLRIINVIDPKRPIQTTEDPPRKCRLIGVLERQVGIKTILLSIPVLGHSAMSSELEIDFNGKSAENRGSALTFVNEPKVESGFFCITAQGNPTILPRAITLNAALDDYPHTHHFLEVITANGVVTDVKLHHRDSAG